MLNGIGEIAERLRRSSVEVLARGGRSAGSGVVWHDPRTIVTNAHVIGDGGARVRFWNGHEEPARLVRRDAQFDLAWLEPEAAFAPAAETRASNDVRPGEFVVAIGNPLGFIGALSTGVVHAVGPVPGLGRRPWIQAQVRLAPGNSGGALADAAGRIIGINAMIVNGIGVAIPSDRVQQFLTGGERPRLGVTLRPVADGLLVLAVEPDGPAARASILPGDILVGFDGQRFTAFDDLALALESAGGTARVSFVRGGSSSVRQTWLRFEAVQAEAA